jgi:alkaline phosphatase D
MMSVVEHAELSRRTFLALGASVVIGACSSGDGAGTASTGTPPLPPTTGALAADPFTVGVAAGDPDNRSAVLWTRLIGAGLPDAVDVAWEVADGEDFNAIVASGSASAVAADGHSVHVVVELSGPAWYRFHAGGFTSPIGRVAPTGDGTAPLRLAAASCQHWETGFYAAHRDIAEWRPDLVVFLGDFIYEGAGAPVGGGRVRSHDGAEPTDLAAYRARYAQYLSDPQLQASRAGSPWLVIWDDHEVENNYAALEPQDPADRAGFPARRAAAYRAWWEHMPVRLPAPVDGEEYVTYRSVRWGDLADVLLLDGRQYRSDQACGDVALSTDPPCEGALDPARTMLGPAQEEWIGAALATSGAAWKVLGQQTVLTDLRLPNGGIVNYDQWDGYAPARERLLAQAAAAERVIVVTGDIHLAGVGRLPGIGTEFVTTSVSSVLGIDPALQPVLASFADVVDAELAHRGYTRHVVTPEAWTAEYRIVDDVTDADSAVSTWRTFRVDATAADLPVTT